MIVNLSLVLVLVGLVLGLVLVMARVGGGC